MKQYFPAYIASNRKGVTPVIAVLLLLMMTVAAAGGAYVWMTQLQEQFQEGAEDDLSQMDRGVGVEVLECDGSEITAYLRNSGDTDLNLNPVDILVEERDTGDRAAEEYGLDLTEGDHLDGDDFSETGDVGQYTFNMEYTFEDTQYYEVTFRLVDEDDYEVTAQCQG